MGKASGQPTQPITTMPNLGPISNPGPNSGISVDNFPPAVTSPAPAPAPVAQPTGPSVFQQSADYMKQAGETYGGLAGFQAPEITAAQLAPAATMQGVGQVGDVTSGQLSTTNMGQYMNPYTQQVIERGQADIERQRQLASENLAAQAQRAGAFGGSRQAVQEGVLAGEALRQAGALSAQQRQQAFQTALQSGQFDIGQRMQADTLNQRAAEMAAAREQAARSGNMQAANQFAIQQAELEQQAAMANQRSAISGAGVRQAGAGGLAGLSSQAFGMGQSAQQAVQQQAMQQRMLEQQILDAQRAQYQSQAGAPLAGLGLTSSILAGLPANQATSYRPGLLDYVMAGSKLF